MSGIHPLRVPKPFLFASQCLSQLVASSCFHVEATSAFCHYGFDDHLLLLALPGPFSEPLRSTPGPPNGPAEKKPFVLVPSDPLGSMESGFRISARFGWNLGHPLTNRFASKQRRRSCAKARVPFRRFQGGMVQGTA